MTTCRGHNELSVDPKTWLNYLEGFQCIPSLVSPVVVVYFECFIFCWEGGHFSDRQFVPEIFDKSSSYCNLANVNIN